MALHHDLLEQAVHLASRERKRPRQASLRRAVSSAYYAIFHLLVSDAARLLSPTNPAGLKIIIGRAFNHGDMRDVCAKFAGGGDPNKRQIPPATRALLTFPLDQGLLRVSEAFVDLQEARHQADYDLTKMWNRPDVANHLQTARQAFTHWEGVRKTPNAGIFMAALLLQKHWARSASSVTR